MEHADVLRLTLDRPVVQLVDGASLVTEGSTESRLYVLVEGELAVQAGGNVIARVTRPGGVVGEIGLLLGTPASADVVAVGDTLVRQIDDAASLFDDHPGFGLHLAVVLARRLRHATSFLGDLDRQFADRDGTLGLVPRVLSGLLGGSAPDVDGGSDREPDAPY